MNYLDDPEVSYMMANRLFHVIDSHTAGNSTRLLMEGVPELPGKTMVQKKRYFQEHYDFIRTTLMQEPRGNSGVLAVLVPPPNQDSYYGLIFAVYRGYVDMCIHGTIGVATTVFECGLATEKVLRSGKISFDSSAGLVVAKLNSANGKVKSVTVNNVPSYLLDEQSLELPGLGKHNISIAFGGNFYAYVDAKKLGLKIIPPNLSRILSTARLFLEELRKVKLPDTPNFEKKERIGICFYEDLGARKSRNIMVGEYGLFDRSPCGTGTCGRMAILNAHGRLGMGEVFRNQSIIGSEFCGAIVSQSKTKLGLKAIIPEVTGSAYLTGISDFIVSEGDNLGHGFLVSTR